MRVEHWEHAVEQGEHAGRRLLEDGPGTPFASVPWFWSDQYDRKLQLAGRPGPGDEVVVVDGDPHAGPAGERRFVLAFRRRGDGGDRCTAVLGVNRPRLVVQARMRLAESLAWEAVAELFGGAS
jgi:NADPH-dependent 2,4-dienoyl-CoA reductase/sulfur reductase-like enzyme